MKKQSANNIELPTEIFGNTVKFRKGKTPKAGSKAM